MRVRRKLIYIAGAGRSGSTMLSLLLSQHPKVQNIGQIRDLIFAVHRGASCSCGADLCDCPFWRPVLKGVLSGLPQTDHTGPRLPQLGMATVERVYRDAFKVSARPVLVDSSKSADLCLMLAELPGFDVFVLNLVRDPRAVAVSWSKQLSRPEQLRKRMQNWVARQKKLEAFGQDHPDRFLCLTYEDLCQEPMAAVARIQVWAGLGEDLSIFRGSHAAHVSWESQHLFAPANADVLASKRSEIIIAAAQHWQSPQMRSLCRWVEPITFPYAQRYGYRRLSGTSGAR